MTIPTVLTDISSAIETPVCKTYSPLSRRKRLAAAKPGLFSDTQYRGMFRSTKDGPQFVRTLIKLSGNGCSHDPRNFRSALLDNPYKTELGEKPDTEKDSKGRKRDKNGFVLRSKVQYSIAFEIAKYAEDRKIIPAIGMARKLKGYARPEPRSERREAIALLGQACAMHMDVISGRIGRPDAEDKEKFHYNSLESLAASVGLSPSRAKRAWQDMLSAKIVTSKKVCSLNESGDYRSEASAKCFSSDFIASLGFKVQHEKTAKNLYKKRKDEAQAEEEAAARSPEAKAKLKMSREMALADAYGDLGRTYTPLNANSSSEPPL